MMVTLGLSENVFKLRPFEWGLKQTHTPLVLNQALSREREGPRCGGQLRHPHLSSPAAAGIFALVFSLEARRASFVTCR